MEFKYVKPGFAPFEQQKTAIKRLIHMRKALINLKAGAGKTCICLFSFAYLKEKNLVKNMLVLTPLSAHEKLVWKKDCDKFFRMTTISLEDFAKAYNSRPSSLPKLLSTYDIIYGKHTSVKQQDLANAIMAICAQPGTVCTVDECHAFRNPKSSLTVQLKFQTSKAPAFWGITATTISRNIENLYNIVNLIYPWFLGPWTMFRDTYCNTMLRRVPLRGGGKRSVTEVTTIKDPVGLRNKLAPLTITDESFAQVNYHFVDYALSEEESSIYRHIAKGITIEESLEPEDWFKKIMSDSTEEEPRKLGNVEQYSNRFVYLQHAADGIISSDGKYTRTDSTKLGLLTNLVSEIAAKGQSVLIYFDYYASLDPAEAAIKKVCKGVTVLRSTGEQKLKEGILTERAVKLRPHVVLCTRASSESVSYYFMNNVIFFHSPTVPSTFVQFLGRITRKNTLYPDDLHCYIFRSQNVDLYKLMVVSGKTRLMEIASGEIENNVPPDYKQIMEKAEAQTTYRRLLLWNGR